MGIFPGAKKYLRQVANCFHTDAEKADVYITDLMLQIYSYMPTGPSTIRQFALHLWRSVQRPDNRPFTEGTVHIVTFDIPIKGFLAKSITQMKRNANRAQLEFSFDGENMPTAIPDCFRDREFMQNLIPCVVAQFIELYRIDICMQGTLVIQYSSAPVMLQKHDGEMKVTYMNNCALSCRIPEGDMSIAFWATYFASKHIMVITKDTDMLCILPYIHNPSRQITLKLYHGKENDYINMNTFCAWLEENFGTIYTGTFVLTLQGNDYVSKCTAGCSPETFINAFLSQKLGSFIGLERNKLILNEQRCNECISRCTMRGRISPTVSSSVRQAFWYLTYTLSSINGLTNCHTNCALLRDGLSVYGWIQNEVTGRIEISNDVFNWSPVFEYVTAFAA